MDFKRRDILVTLGRTPGPRDRGAHAKLLGRVVVPHIPSTGPANLPRTPHLLPPERAPRPEPETPA